jgi:hypothetical protein
MAYIFRLEHEEGTPTDPPTLRTAVPDWHPSDTIPLGQRLCAWSRFETMTRIKRRCWWLRTLPQRATSGDPS